MEMLKQDSPGLADTNRESCREAWRDHREGQQHLLIGREISPKKKQDPWQHRNRKSWKIGPRPTGSMVGIECQAVHEHKTRLGGVVLHVMLKFSGANRHHDANQHKQNPT